MTKLLCAFNEPEQGESKSKKMVPPQQLNDYLDYGDATELDHQRRGDKAGWALSHPNSKSTSKAKLGLI